MNTTDYVKETVSGLSLYCERWNYDWFEKLRHEPTPKNFYKIFCKITRTFYFDIDDVFYSVEFSKDNMVRFKRTGKDYDEREPDAIIEIEEIIEEIKSRYKNNHG